MESFKQFLKRVYPQFQMDDYARPIIDKLDLYMRRDERFESDKYIQPIHVEEIGVVQDRLYLNKGILMLGVVGTGKTEVMDLFNQYLRCELHPLAYKMISIFDAADAYRERGVEALSFLQRGNLLIDELALEDPQTRFPDQELVNHFGNKLLLGSYIVDKRYIAYKRSMHMTHFITNSTLTNIRNFYGSRAFSRLIEMCNVILYIGKDRRIKSRPIHFAHQPVQKVVPKEQPKETFQYDDVIRGLLNRIYADWLDKGELNISVSHYDFLKSYGISLADPGSLKEGVLNELTIGSETIAPARGEIKSVGEVLAGYQKTVLDPSTLHRKCCTRSVVIYFEEMKKQGKTILFDEPVMH